jgi:hypothetical protein
MGYMNTQFFKNPKLNDYVRDPVWQFWGVIIGLMAIVISSYITYDLFYRSQTAGLLTVTLEGKYSIVYRDPAYEDELEIYFQGAKALNVSSLLFNLRYEGNLPIRPDDYITPLRFTVSPPAQIAKIEVIKLVPKTVDVSVKNVLTDSFQLSDSLLNSKDTVSFRATLVNDPDPNGVPTMSVSGRIAGVQDIVVRSETEVTLWSFTTGYFRYRFIDLVRLGIFTSILFYSTFFILRTNIPNYLSQRYLEVRITLIAFLSGWTMYWLDRLIKNIFFNTLSQEWWQFFLPGFIVGAIVIGLYIIYLSFLLRSAKAQNKFRNSEKA